MFGYLPNSKAGLYRRYRNEYNKNFISKRKFHKIENMKYIYPLLFWISLGFAIKVGQVMPITFYDYSKYSGLPIQLPTVEFKQYHYKKDNSLCIWLTIDQNIAMTDKLMTFSDFPEFLNELKCEQIIETIYLFADRQCEMQDIRKILDVLIKYEIYKVNFVIQ